MRAVFDPRLLSVVAESHYPARVNVEQPVLAQDSYGQPIPSTWEALYLDLPAYITPPISAGGTSSGEVRRPDGTITREVWTVALAGHFMDITDAMRVVTEGSVYQVLRVDHDAHKVQTRLLCEVLRPEGQG